MVLCIAYKSRNICFSHKIHYKWKTSHSSLMHLVFPSYVVQMPIWQKMARYYVTPNPQNIYLKKKKGSMPVLTVLVQIQRNLHMLIFTTLSLFYYNIYHFNYKYNYNIYINDYKILKSRSLKCIIQIHQLREPC